MTLWKNGSTTKVKPFLQNGEFDYYRGILPVIFFHEFSAVFEERI